MIKLSSRNTVIYGHANKKMFGPLLTTLSNKKWQTDTRNHIIKLETPNNDTYWRIVYVNKVSKSLLSTSNTPTRAVFEKGEFIKWANNIIKNSKYDFNYNKINDKTQFLTLITCDGLNEKDRIVVQAVLVCKIKPGGSCKVN